MEWSNFSIYSCKYIFVPFVCLAAAASGRKYERRAYPHTDIDTERDTKTERKKRKNTVAYRTAHRCSFYGWLATEFLDSSLAQFAWLRIVWMPVQKTKRTNRVAATPSPPPRPSTTFQPASLACKLCKYLFKNFTLKCICGWVPSVAAMLLLLLLLPECRKKRTERIEMVEGGEHPSSCDRISKAASQCPKLLLSAAGRRTKCEQTVEISKALPTF